MIKTKYTAGFEKFWKTWKAITGEPTDKPVAFKYWKRDKLEGDVDELIRILKLQQAERERFKANGEWIPKWCFCRKWLNNRRYEYVPEPPKTRKIVPVKLTPEEIKYRAEMNTPEIRAAKAEYIKLQEELFGKDGKKIIKPFSPKEFNDKRNQALNALKEKAGQS